MSETLARQGTVGFTRKVNLGDYNMAEAFISIQFDVPTDPELTVEALEAAVLANARHGFFQAKALVLEQLGLAFDLTEDGVLVETVKSVFPNTTVEPQTSAAAPPSTPSTPPAVATGGDSPANPPHSTDTSDAAEKKANQAWARDRWAVNPSEFFDNRPKKADGSYKSTAPDVKHKATGIGVWF